MDAELQSIAESGIKNALGNDAVGLAEVLSRMAVEVRIVVIPTNIVKDPESLPSVAEDMLGNKAMAENLCHLLLSAVKKHQETSHTVYEKPRELEDYFTGSIKEKPRNEPSPLDEVPDLTPVKPMIPPPRSRIDIGSLTRAHEDIVVPGRQACECQARRHKLISNCLACGRVVCEQEGAGPCIFCGAMVLAKDGRDKPSRATKKLQHAARLEAQSIAAEKERDKLLEYDRNAAQRTIVVDDQADYFRPEDSWLTPTERLYALKQEAKKRERDSEGRNKSQNVTFDLAGRRIVNDERAFANPSIRGAMPVYIPRTVDK